MRMMPAATRRGVARADHLTAKERVAQAARPTHRNADAQGGRFQTQAMIQRQHHRLGLSQLFHRLRCGDRPARLRDDFLPFRCPRHATDLVQPR